ncbi:MAG: BrnT family toxin [Ardenticatenaceae bacterium]|nr:BrnT family toxin [Ardenticatenaceae bacterium]
MKIEYDQSKDRNNLEKHGVFLQDAVHLEWDMLLAIQDTRYDYDEIRMIGYAPIGRRVFCVVYTDRDDVRRIISLRKANKREVKRYADQI